MAAPIDWFPARARLRVMLQANGAVDTRSLPAWNIKPADLDWNRYVAPVRWREWTPPQFFNFRNYRDFSGGILTDNSSTGSTPHTCSSERTDPAAIDIAGGLWVAKDGRTVP